MNCLPGLRVFLIVAVVSPLLMSACKAQTASESLRSIQKEQPSSKQAVLVYLRLSDGEHGTEQEREAIFKLESELEKKIKLASAGEFDGNEFGGGFATLFMYGPDANKLFDVTIEAIRHHKPREGSYVIKQYGKPGEKEEKVAL